MSMIKIENITKTYNKGEESEVQALNGVNLTIEQGDLCSIVGVSGSGKSTLLYILGCLDKQTSGSYLLEGEDISKKTDVELSKLRNKKIGFVLQEFGLIEEESVYENIYVPLLFAKKTSKEQKQITELLKKMQIEELRNKKVKRLSGGQRQRVAIARALVNNPNIILADEPTGALDSKTSETIMNIFIELNKQGKTIIIVTHNQEIARRTKKCFTMKDGLIWEQNK